MDDIAEFVHRDAGAGNVKCLAIERPRYISAWSFAFCNGPAML